MTLSTTQHALWLESVDALKNISLEDFLPAIRDALFSTISPTRAHNTPTSTGIKLDSDAAIQTLNHDFRGQDKPTNVLSFPTDDADAIDPDDHTFYLGDIILATGTLIKEAEEANIPLHHHAIHLIVHGLLHLIGFDHENDEDAALMEALEVKILAKLNINNPYL